MLHEHYCEHSNGFRVLLEDVQSTVTGDAGVRAPLGDSIECVVMAWGIAINPEAHQRVEGLSASNCEVSGMISNGQTMWKPLSITHGDGGGIQPEDTNRQSLLGAQVRTNGSTQRKTHTNC